MKAFFRFLTSGFGTNTMAGKALGMTIAVCLIGVWLIWWVSKKIYQATAAKKASDQE